MPMSDAERRDAFVEGCERRLEERLDRERDEGKVPVKEYARIFESVHKAEKEAACDACSTPIELIHGVWTHKITQPGPITFDHWATPRIQTSYGRIAGGGAFPRAGIPLCKLCGQPKSCHVPEGHAFEPRSFHVRVAESDIPQVREGDPMKSYTLSDAELESLKPIPGQRPPLTEYDRIRSMPTSIEPDWIRGTMGVHEKGFRAYHILDKVKRLLADGVPGPTVRELIEHMESKP